MKKELSDKLYADFPSLYGSNDNEKMLKDVFWGFECSDGWYNLLYTMSERLQPICEDICKENKDGLCYNCYHEKAEHDGNGVCQAIITRPLFSIKTNSCYLAWSLHNLKGYKGMSAVKRLIGMVEGMLKARVSSLVNEFFYSLVSKWNIGFKEKCWCDEYEVIYPRVTQLKEKFGALRVYMSYYSKEIDDVIKEAEEKSRKTCESCGKPGEINEFGWLSCLCDDCRKIEK